MLCSCSMHFDQQLLDHIKYRRNAEAKLMLNEHLAKKSNCRGTLLHHAAAVGNEEIAKHLIDLGGLVDSPGPNATTPLMVAVERGNVSDVRVFLEAGANIDVADAGGESSLYKALHSACIDFEIVKALLLRARAETPTKEELTERLLAVQCPFAYFVLLRDVGILANLLQRGFDVNEKTCMQRSALHFAALVKNLKSAELLVAWGADVNAADYCSAGPLYYAAERADPGMMRFLLEHGADPEPEVHYIGQTPLYACFVIRENGEEEVRECAELLLERGTFPSEPCSLVEQIRLCYRNILRSSRLNCLVAHQAALDALEVPGYEEHLTTFAELREYYDECRGILGAAVVGEVTVLSLLDSYRDHEMRLRARDQAFVRQVEQFCAKPEFRKSFSYYARSLTSKIAKVARVVELEKKASLVVCALFKCDYNQLSIFARQLVGYLSERELEGLCRV